MPIQHNTFDSGWKFNPSTSIPNRGFHDYARTIVFPQALSEEEIESVCSWLEKNECPGWTGVLVNKGITKTLPPGTYCFCTTNDSSD